LARSVQRKFDVLLYDLTRHIFEVNASDLPEWTSARHGYSRDTRPECPQVVIRGGDARRLDVAYRYYPGNTAGQQDDAEGPRQNRAAITLFTMHLRSD